MYGVASIPTVLDSAAAQALLQSFPPPAHISVAKVLDHLDGHFRRYIGMSPFCIPTADRDGNQDVSPRGDPAGGFRVLDERTLCIADRPGDNRIDSLRHIAENPHIGLLFFVPGSDETVRVNGRAHLSTDPDLLAFMAANDKRPRLGIVVSVEMAYLHCAKAFKRARFWDPATFVEPGELPSFSRVISDQTRLSREQGEQLHAHDERSNKEALWEPLRPVEPKSEPVAAE